MVELCLAAAPRVLQLSVRVLDHRLQRAAIFLLFGIDLARQERLERLAAECDDKLAICGARLLRSRPGWLLKGSSAGARTANRFASVLLDRDAGLRLRFFLVGFDRCGHRLLMGLQFAALDKTTEYNRRLQA